MGEENKKIRKYPAQMKTKHKDSKPMGYSESSSKREIYSNTVLPQQTRKISNNKDQSGNK